jgi:Na+-transporting NADH:ubiquinone oxidoreductase subunit NqrD
MLWQTLGILGILGALIVATTWRTAQIMEFVAPFGVSLNT